MSGDTRIGLEVDGARVTVVESLGGMAVASRSVSMGSMRESLEVALSGIPAKKGGPALRIAIVCAGAAMRRLDVTTAVMASRPAFEEAVFEVLPVARDASAVSGVFADRGGMVGDAVSTGAAAVLPLSVVEEVYAALGSRRAEVVASPLVLGEYDGVWVGLHYSAAEVTLVRAGFPVAFRQLRAGGLAGLAALLGDSRDPATGQQRLAGAITRTATDPIADAELSRYLRMVGTEVAQTLEFWRRQGEEVPEGPEVVTYGYGGGALALRNAFEESGLAPLMPEDMITQLAYVAPGDREAAMLAYLASITVGDQMPQVSFSNPRAEQVAEGARRRRMRLVKTLGVVGVVGALVFAFGLPFLTGYLDARTAADDRRQAEAAAASVQGVYHQVLDLEARTGIADAELASEPSWSQVLKQVYATRPAGTDVTRVAATTQDGQVFVSVDATKPAGTYGELSQWLDRLTEQARAVDAWTSGFGYANDTASYQLTFRLMTDDVPSARSPLGQDAGAPADGAPPADGLAVDPPAPADPETAAPVPPAPASSAPPAPASSAPPASPSLQPSADAVAPASPAPTTEEVTP